MKSQELAKLFGDRFGFTDWPKTYEVDADTYANCCQTVFSWALERQFPDTSEALFMLKIAVGPNNGLMFKNVELILKERT